MANVTRRDALKQSVAMVAMAGLPAMASGAAESKKLRVVVAGAHPDDPESGCGGAIALYTKAGHEVINLYFTRGEAGISGKSHEEAARIRTAEAEAACHILGARPVFATQIDGATEVTAHAYDEIRTMLQELAPDVVLTHWPIDTHRDHRAISLLVYEAWLRLERRFELYYFEVEAGDQTQHFPVSHYVDIAQVEPLKREACMAHKSQKPKGGFYDLHQEMHRFRGREAGVEAAEAYVRHSANLGGIS